MTAKRFYNILAILLGYGLIIGGFLVFGESLEDKVKILDIIVSCLIFTQFVQFSLFPLINFGDSSHKEVGMMGIHIYVLSFCCIVSIGIMLYGIIYHIPFKFQLMGQLVVLFILLVGRVATLHAGEKVQQIHRKEQVIMHGKLSLKSIMDDFMDDIATVTDLDPIVKQKLTNIHEAMRFLSPSSKSEAIRFDEQFSQSVEDLKIMMRNTNLNREKILEETEHLERTLSIIESTYFL